MTLLKTRQPARKIGMRHRGVSGRVALDGGTVAFESSLERDLCILLSCDPAALEVLEQPVRIDYEDAEGRPRHYTPDYLARFRNGESRLYEVKYREDLAKLWPGVKPKYRAAIRYAREHGMRFQILTEREIRGPYLKNAKFLRAYRDVRREPAIEEHLASTLMVLGETTPRLLIEAAYRSGSCRVQAIPHLWRMILEHRIHTDLLEPLTMKSTIWIINGEGFSCDPHSWNCVLDL